MSWAPFWGALAGAVIGVLAAVGILGAWDYLAERRAQKKQPLTLDDTFDTISESQLEQYIVEHFDALFPGWRIFDDSPESAINSNEGHRPTGIRYRTEAGEIDLLCVDRQGHLVVIELKRYKAPDRVVSQIDRYIAWVKQNLAQPGQRVRGLIIAKSFGGRLSHTLSRRRGIRIWTYAWQLKFNKRPDREV